MENIDKLLQELDDLMSSDDELLSKEKKQTILEKINRVLEIDPQNIDALRLKALNALYSYNDYDTATPILNKIIEIAPDSDTAKEAEEHLKVIKTLKDIDNSVNNNFINNNFNTIECNFLEKIPCELIFGIKVIVLLIIIWILFPSVFFSGNDNKILKIRNTSAFETLKINPRSEYSFLTKKEIFDIRKRYVQDSIFARKNYKPSAREFGSIANNKPWWGNIRCQELDYKGDYTEHIQGKSEQSLKINNPNMLVSLNNYVIPWHTEANDDFCTSEYSKFLPHSLKYDKNNKLLVIEYQVPRRFLDMRANISGNSVRFPIQLSGLNALDFGYKYVYAFDTKNIQMYDYNNNITKHIGEFVDYIHLGNSCKYKGGCNNISPVQFDKMIMLTNLPAEINLKLWKNEPINKYIKADIYYKIVFNELF